MQTQMKMAVTVAEMARMLGLSRSRLYQLIGTAMPEPSRDDNGRPFYNEEQQALCLEVRRRNCGVDGKPILFYAPRAVAPIAPASRKRSTSSKTDEKCSNEILDGVRALGLATATKDQVGAAISQSFPNGTDGVDPGEIIRRVFLSIKRNNAPDKLER